MAGRSLPLYPDERVSSLRKDGSRNFVYPADVRGRFTRARFVVFYVLIAIWAVLPWIQVGGHPAVFLDVERRSFFLFGLTFNAQDIWLMFFLLTGVAFGLVYVTAVLGRAWCGWACPQTVFLEGVFRKLERWVLGSREQRMRLARGPWTLEKLGKQGLLQVLYVVAAFLVAHVFLSYFVSLPAMFRMVRAAPAAHPEAFAWMLSLTVAFYVNFAWFREQLCLIVCPYGRMQSALVDADSLVVGYDAKRGEPRGKASDKNAGDCVDCKRCVVVCPTGIDIRNGLQLDCIACTQCIDACDEVMDKLGRPRGLVRYDSENGLEGKPRRVLRPRLYVYTALLVLGAVVATVAVTHRKVAETNLLRLPGAPYVIEGDVVRNAFELHLVNKRPERETFHLEAEPAPGATFVLPLKDITLEPLGDVRAPVFVTVPTASFAGDFPVRVRVSWSSGSAVATGRFLGAKVTGAAAQGATNATGAKAP